MSTFHGLEMAKRALFAQQGALYTTGHNISNVNTEGYSRQRVNFKTSSAYPAPSRMQDPGAGQLGTGVDIGVIDRVRNKFLDMQFRSENSRSAYWNTRANALSRMEELLNEPGENGLSKTMDRFWQSLQDLADHPENDGARSVVAQRGLALAETFNHLSNNLHKIQKDLKTEIDQSADDINQLLDNINDVNKQIQKIEPHGKLANDLYDERNLLIDELSRYVNIKVHEEKSSESAPEIADGLVSIEIVDHNGNQIEDGIYLIDVEQGLDDAVNALSIVPGKDEEAPITEITVENQDVEGLTILEKVENTGSFASLIKAYGYGDDENGDYPKVLAKLDKMANEFAEAFNRVHKAGSDVDGNQGKDFFVQREDGGEINAGNISISSYILEDGNLIAASDPSGGSRNGNNALELANIFDDDVMTDSNGEPSTSVRKFYNALIGDIGVQGQEAGRMKENAAILKNQVNDSRMSTSAVSLDEEISNMIKFQHAYNAAARNMTAVDELLDRIINQMGLVGR